MLFRSPLLSARLAATTHPLGACVLVLLGTAGCVPFALLHGFGNGILTIAKGTLPLLFFGAQGYGARQGFGSCLRPRRRFGRFAQFRLGVDEFGFGTSEVRGDLGAPTLGFRFTRLGRTRFGLDSGTFAGHHLNPMNDVVASTLGAFFGLDRCGERIIRNRLVLFFELRQPPGRFSSAFLGRADFPRFFC